MTSFYTVFWATVELGHCPCHVHEERAKVTAAEAAKAVADILEQVALENRRKVLEAQESLVICLKVARQLGQLAPKL